MGIEHDAVEYVREICRTEGLMDEGRDELVRYVNILPETLNPILNYLLKQTRRNIFNYKGENAVSLLDYLFFHGDCIIRRIISRESFLYEYIKYARLPLITNLSINQKILYSIKKWKYSIQYLNDKKRLNNIIKIYSELIIDNIKFPEINENNIIRINENIFNRNYQKIKNDEILLLELNFHNSIKKGKNDNANKIFNDILEESNTIHDNIKNEFNHLIKKGENCKNIEEMLEIKEIIEYHIDNRIPDDIENDLIILNQKLDNEIDKINNNCITEDLLVL